MRVAKLAISVPAETLRRVGRAARRLGMTRSGYISAVLARVAAHERDASVAKRVDQVLAALDEQDLDSLDRLHATRRDDGTEW